MRRLLFIIFFVVGGLAPAAFGGDISSARDQLHHVAIVLSRQLQASSDYQSSRLTTLRAFWAYETAKSALINQVESSPEGMAANIRVDRLEEQLVQAREESKLAGRDHSQKTDAIAMALLNARSAMSQREAKALAENDGVNTLRYAWLDANSALQAIQNDLAERVQADPQWKSAKAQLEQARGAVVAAAE